MMTNIYDIFNSRKDSNIICEGFELENIALDESTDIIEDLEDIIFESDNEFAELRAAMYMGDVVIENAIFDDFDEEYISELMEGAMSDRINSLKESIKKLWAKIIAWFKKVIENVKNFFTSGEKLVEKYEKDFPAKLKQSAVRAKVYEYRPISDARKFVDGRIDAVKAAGMKDHKSVADGKAAILAACGAKDSGQIANVVKQMFVQSEKPVEQPLSKLDAGIIISYVKNKKDTLDLLRKHQELTNKEFQHELDRLQEAERKADGEAQTKAVERVSIFQFAINCKTKILNAMISCYKKGYSDNRQIMLKVLGGKVSEDEKEEAKSEDEKNKKAQEELKAKLKAKRGIKDDEPQTPTEPTNPAPTRGGSTATRGRGVKHAPKKPFNKGRIAKHLLSYMVDFDDIEFIDDVE